MQEVRVLEQEMVRMLSRLPVPVVVVLPDRDLDGCSYSWRCMEGSGTATSFDGALEQALHFLMGRLAGSALPGFHWLDWYPHK